MPVISTGTAIQLMIGKGSPKAVIITQWSLYSVTRNSLQHSKDTDNSASSTTSTQTFPNFLIITVVLFLTAANSRTHYNVAFCVQKEEDCLNN